MSLSIEQVSEALAKLSDARSALESTFLGEAELLDAKIDKMQTWLWENGSHTGESLVEEYIHFRDKRAQIKKQYDIQDTRFKEYMTQRESKLLEMMQTMGVSSVRTSFGTAYTQDKARYNCADWPSYWGYIKENDRFDLLEKRPSQAPLAKMEEEGIELPPGINTYKEKTVTVRRS